jgi:iron complex outermembrane receptor protein
MHKNGTPQLAGKFPFQTEATVYAAGRTPDNCVIDHLGGEDARAARGALRWQPAPNVELNISGDYTTSKNDSAAEKIYETDYQQTYGKVRALDEFGGAWGEYTGAVQDARANQNFITAFDQFSVPGTPFRWDERFNTGSIYTTYDNFCDPFPAGTKITGNTYYNGSLFRGGNGCDKRTVPLESWGLSAKLTVGIDDHLEAAIIGGYREMETEFGAAWDGTPLADSIIFHRDTTWNWNGELRLTGRYDWFDFSAGLFYYKGFADENGRPQNVRLGTQQYQNVYYSPNAKAGYLNVSVRPLDGLSLNGGIRRSEDNKFVDYAALQDNSVPGSTTFTPAGTSTYFTLPIHNTRWDWKLGADYRINDSLMVYASAATGYRLPGFATRVFQVGQIEQQFPTALINYEIGFKADLFDRRLRVNGAAFMIAYSQRNGVFGGQEARLATDGKTILAGTTLANTMTLITDGPDNTAFTNNFSNCRLYDAATDGPRNGTSVGIQCITRQWNYPVTGGDKVKGLELEATAQPIDGLAINYSLGYTDRGSTTGRPIGFPDWTMSGGIQYKIDAAPLNGTLTPRLDWFYISKVAWSSDYTHLDDPARSTFNARLTYRNTHDNYEIALGVTNLFDKEYYLNKTVFIQGLGAPANIGQPAAPREWYLSISKHF